MLLDQGSNPQPPDLQLRLTQALIPSLIYHSSHSIFHIFWCIVMTTRWRTNSAQPHQMPPIPIWVSTFHPSIHVWIFILNMVHVSYEQKTNQKLLGEILLMNTLLTYVFMEKCIAYFFTKTYVVGWITITCSCREIRQILCKLLLMSKNNICFHGEIRKKNINTSSCALSRDFSFFCFSSNTIFP